MDENKKPNKKDMGIAAAAVGSAALVGTAAWLLMSAKSEPSLPVPIYACPDPYFYEDPYDVGYPEYAAYIYLDEDIIPDTCIMPEDECPTPESAHDDVK